MKDRSLNTCCEHIVPTSIYWQISHLSSTTRDAEFVVFKKQNYYFLSRPVPFFTLLPLTFVCKLLLQVTFTVTVQLRATPVFT